MRLGSLGAGLAAVATLAAAAVAALAATDGPAVAADGQEVPMCNGRSDPNLVVIAHANRGSKPKFVLNVATDASGAPTGTLILDRGPGHLAVTDWCRVWQHTPDSEPRCGMPYPEGATTAHAVGQAVLPDGTPIVVRADVRETDDGTFYRLRYRPLGMHDEALADEGGGCEDESWTWVPSEDGWGVLDQLRVRVTA
jgi:hypothetical protein